MGAASPRSRTHELANPAYTANDGARCAHCKDALLDVVAPLAESEEATIVLGVNVDDLGDRRPGQQAASRRGAVFPLVDAGFSKRDVRSASKALGLRTWDKPAAACLPRRHSVRDAGHPSYPRGSRLPSRDFVHSAFAALRVRHYGELARIELDVDDLVDAVSRRADIVAAVRSAGYRYVTLDLEGLRSGNLNAGLTQAAVVIEEPQS